MVINLKEENISNGNNFSDMLNKCPSLSGIYLNEEKNGKGKEYYNDGILEFEGEYLNGKRNGKGNEYNNDGKLIFEGEYLDGKKWNGKGYI